MFESYKAMDEINNNKLAIGGLDNESEKRK